MSDNIISYIEMCRREATSLQQGMNFGIGGNHSVILMSIRRNAPYRDRLEDGGTTLIYEGHDQPKGPHSPNPKVVDQPERFPSGGLTQMEDSMRRLNSIKPENAIGSVFEYTKSTHWR